MRRVLVVIAAVGGLSVATVGGASATDLAVKHRRGAVERAFPVHHHHERRVVVEDCRIGWWLTYNRDIYQFPPRWNHKCAVHARTVIRSRY